MTALLLSVASIPFMLGVNLTVNQGFENLEPNGIPTRWALFVQPWEQTSGEAPFGRVDDKIRYSGERSVLLSTPTAYPEEPYNNWSQNIITAAGERTVRATGHIRTQKVGQAALWIQCWRKHPLGVCAFSTSETLTPLAGDHDWTTVQAEINAPPETQFLTVRCVLKGVGMAWFDDISVELSEPPKQEAAPAPSPTTETKSKADAVLEDARRKASILRLMDQSETPLTAQPDLSMLPAMPAIPEAPKSVARPEAPDQPTPQQQPKPSPEEPPKTVVQPDGDKTREEMKQVNEDLQGTLREIRESNKAMSEQLQKMRDELKGLREQVRESRPQKQIPPIVPRKDYGAE